jgi:hypothetical protein
MGMVTARRAHRRSLALLAALTLGGAACSTSSATSTAVTTTTTTATTTVAATTTSTTSTSTIAATTTTTALPDDDVPPEIDLTADTFADFDHWWVEANRFYEWLGTHPTDDRDVLSILYHPAGPEIAQEIELNAAYLRDGVRWPNASLGDAIAVGCCPDPQHYMDGGRIPLLVVTTHPETTLVTDAEGNLIEELGGWARFTWKVEVVETDPGVWLVWDLGEALE